MRYDRNELIAKNSIADNPRKRIIMRYGNKVEEE